MILRKSDKSDVCFVHGFHPSFAHAFIINDRVNRMANSLSPTKRNILNIPSR